MIFLGDLAIPTASICNQLDICLSKYKFIFEKDDCVINLEGVLTHEDMTYERTPVLFNHDSIIPLLKKLNVKVTALANNHTLDIPNNFESTCNLLTQANIKWVGASSNLERAYQPVELIESGSKAYIFNYCWDFLLYHQQNPSKNVHVATIDETKIIDTVIRLKEKDPDASIVVYFHWSLDLEILPFPMYRTFSKELIDAGVNVVVGCHSHCFQGGEKYKNGYIVYGLGNFFIPNGIYANKKLSFPQWSNKSLVFQWNPLSNKATCHWFENVSENGKYELRHTTSQSFEEFDKSDECNFFQKATDQDYELYFKKNRRKKLLIPIYKSRKNTIQNRIFTNWLKFRATSARTLAKLGALNWQQ